MRIRDYYLFIVASPIKRKYRKIWRRNQTSGRRNEHSFCNIY